jgi:hypothetical protein
MQTFQLAHLSGVFLLLADHEARSQMVEHTGPDARLTDGSSSVVIDGLVMAVIVLQRIGFLQVAEKFVSSIDALKRLGMSPLASAVVPELRNCKEALQVECGRHLYLRIPADLSVYFCAKHLFGYKVSESFPSADQDILEAGNCLATGCNTACVFHLMRAAEIALRVLARDRMVVYPGSSADDQQCGTLITSLDSKLSELRKANKNLWPSESVKNEQVRFYQSATIELRSFNEAWRKHVCHAGADSFYDSHQALSVFEHVRTFIQILSAKISEHSITPQYWDLDVAL